MMEGKQKNLLKSTALFILEGKTDLLLIGLFCLILALFIFLYAWK